MHSTLCDAGRTDCRTVGRDYHGRMAGPLTLEVGGREVAITHPDKVGLPAGRRTRPVTKLDLVDYYLAVADGALRGVAGRPMILKRFVKGITEEAVFQKRAPAEAAGLGRRRRAALRVRAPRPRRRWSTTPPGWPGRSTWAASTSTRTRSAPTTSTIPTNCAIDLDPMPGVEWPQIVDVAAGGPRGARRPRPDRRGRRPRAREGFHVYARIAAALALRAGATGRRDRRPRGGAPRARPGDQPVVEGGTPGRVRRLQPERQGPHGGVGLLGARRPRTRGCPRRCTGTRCPAAGPRQFTIATVPARFAERGDPWAAMDDAAGSLDVAARAGRRNSGPPRTAAEGAAKPLIEIARTKTRDEALAALDDWRARAPRGRRPAAAGRRPGRRHARAEFDLVPHPDQPGARAAGAAAAAGGPDRRLQPLGRVFGPSRCAPRCGWMVRWPRSAAPAPSPRRAEAGVGRAGRLRRHQFLGRQRRSFLPSRTRRRRRRLGTSRRVQVGRDTLVERITDFDARRMRWPTTSRACPVGCAGCQSVDADGRPENSPKSPSPPRSRSVPTR